MESNSVKARQHFLNSFLNEAKDGKTFTVEFVKKDGTKRVMNARLGVKKGVNGKGMAYKPTERGLLPVYDMANKGFRMVNFETVTSYTSHGRTVQNVSYNN